MSGTSLVTYDLLDRVKTVTPQAPQKSLVYTYTPDSANKRWKTTVALGGVGNYEYREDSKGRLHELVNPVPQTFRMEYDLDGKNTLTVFPNGVKEERSYLTQDWLSLLVIRGAGGGILNQFSYYYTNAQGGYFPTGHLQREVDQSGRTHAFFYNNLYELVQETHPDYGTLTYGFDLNGNRTSLNDDGTIDYYGVDANNKLLWVNRSTNAPPTSGQANPYTLFQYDVNGNMTRRERKYSPTLTRVLDFYWDGDDRLRLVKEGATNRFTGLYDGDGLRVQKTENWPGLNQTHNYSWGPGGVLHDSSGDTRFTPGLAQRQGTSSSTDRFYHGDWLGSTRHLTESGGNSFAYTMRYDAFGLRSAAADTSHTIQVTWTRQEISLQGSTSTIARYSGLSYRTALARSA